MEPMHAQAVIEGIASGKFLDDICGKDGIPSRSTVWRYQLSNPEFATQCAHAREVSAELNERRIAGVVDDVLTEKVAPDAARVAINGLTWLAKVRAPKVYGDAVDVKHSGNVNLTVAQSDLNAL